MFSKGSGCGRIITSKICSSCLRYSVAFCGHLVRAGRMVVTISFVSSSIIQGEPKNTEPIKMLINPTSSNLVDLNFSLWMIFPQSFSHLSQFAYNLYVLSKMCSKWHPRRWRHTCIRRAKLSMTHSSLGICLIFAVIAAFSSPIVWGLFSYIILEIPPQIKIWGVQVWWTRYVAVLMKFWASFGRCRGIDRDEQWFRQDGGYLHTTNDSLAWLRERLKDRLISRKCEIEWAAHSPDLNPIILSVGVSQG